MDSIKVNELIEIVKNVANSEQFISNHCKNIVSQNICQLNDNEVLRVLIAYNLIVEEIEKLN